MDRCREKVIVLIDQALECRSRLDFCSCVVVGNRVVTCNGCKIKRALRMARSCIVTVNERSDLLNVKLIGVQDAIEDKLQAFLADEDLTEEGAKHDE